MRNQIKILVAALIVAAMVFSTGCPPAAEQAPDNTAANTPAAEQAPDRVADSPPDPPIPNTCVAGPRDGSEVNNELTVNGWIKKRFENMQGPLKDQYDQEEFKIYATDVERKGVTYTELIVSGKIHGDGTLQALNGIIQPLTKARSGPKGGPCVTAVKYITVAEDGKSETQDFEWSICEPPYEVCSNGTCSLDCGSGRTRIP